MNEKHIIQESDWRNNPEARDMLIVEARREVSKNGSLIAFETVFRELAAFFSKDDILSLYYDLRESRRSETEWRPEFLDIFSQIEECELPSIIYNYPNNNPYEGTAESEPLFDSDEDEEIPF